MHSCLPDSLLNLTNLETFSSNSVAETFAGEKERRVIEQRTDQALTKIANRHYLRKHTAPKGFHISQHRRDFCEGVI